MPKIPSTFCPAKWDEIHINTQQSYVYACCKATPIKFNKNINEVLLTQQHNLLNEIQDSSCNYCWQIESNNYLSRRHEYLKTFDIKNFDNYQTDTITPKQIEINLGNECNFQCLYCNPKFSSQWEMDIRKKPYKIFNDKFNYKIIEVTRSTTQSMNLKILEEFKEIQHINFIGGEPLLNKNLWNLINDINASSISVVTNLSCDIKQLDRLFELHTKFKKINIGISIDATKDIAEFVRYGLDFDKFSKNLTYIFNTAPNNINVSILSLMTSITILDLKSFTKLIEQWKNQFPKLKWTLSYCETPMTQGFTTLQDIDRQEALKNVQYIKTLDYVFGTTSIEGSLNITKFNDTLYKQMIHFMNEFAQRKQIKIPACLN